jgi:hypothetical protein
LTNPIYFLPKNPRTGVTSDTDRVVGHVDGIFAKSDGIVSVADKDGNTQTVQMYSGDTYFLQNIEYIYSTGTTLTLFDIFQEAL